ncbi:MAG: Hpt domain-containing protein, partial [Burkholderiales bacterium]
MHPMLFNEDARTVEATPAAHDLGPLAWVLDELRKVLERTSKTLRRTARELQAAQAAGTDLAPIAAALKPLPQPLQQSAGALQMVEMPAVAVLLRSLEDVMQQFVARPELCTAEAASTVERAGAAVVEYLETVLAGTSVPAVSLFPQYREVVALGDGDKAHPADLWSFDWHWVNPGLSKLPALSYDTAVRARMDQAVLSMVKTGDVEAAQEISGLALQLATAQTHERPSIFWQVSAAFFEAFALGLLPADLYVKRLASRLLMQYSALARGDDALPSVLLRDLLFFCAQAGSRGADASVLGRVQKAFGLLGQTPTDYEKRHFGRFDAVLLAQTRKRIQAVAETWSAVAGGDVNRMRSAVEQFQQLSEAMVQMQPESADFARALSQVVADMHRSGRMPSPPLSMEVATSVLYLQAAYDDLDQDDMRLAERLTHLADRLQQVRSGGLPQPLESWMEELYGRVSDRRTMGSVVAELKASLAETEKLLDQYFRDGSDPAVLPPAAARLSQMRGVLSVLGLDHASQAVIQMRDAIDRLASNPADVTQVSEKLGNNVGALSFLIDMLGYQPTLAKKLFVYDETRGELLPVMGRSASAATPVELTVPVIELAPMVEVPIVLEPAVDLPVTAGAVATAEPVGDGESVDSELLEIFLEEVREVITTGVGAVAVLEANPVDANNQASLRRAFHTLKGSSRMVGLMAFGNAAWSFEQLHNNWLAEQKPADAPLMELSRNALLGFGRWANAIATNDVAAWSAVPFE